LDRYIIEPAEIQDTGYAPNLPMETIVPGHRGIGASVESAPPAAVSLAYAAGGMYSTARDLMLWERALAENRILSGELTDLLFQEHATASYASGYGYGWSIGESYIRGTLAPSYSHGGAITGFRSHILRIPEEEGVTIVLCNVLPAAPEILADAITRVLYK
jgi:D-alanyl-D-alanine carboxypeptidase